MNIIDISYRIMPKLCGYPNEPKTEFIAVCTINNDCPVKVSEIICSSHVGTHIDAPSHYIKNGLTIDQLPLDAFIGPCTVVDLEKQMPLQSITSDLIKHLVLAPRVLFKTGSTDLSQNFPDSFPYISNECVDYLASQKTLLIGVDTPSVDHFISKDLPIHHLCSQHDIKILESLDLSKVAAGLYTLVALPLKFEGLDASPTRAILLKNNI